MLAKWRLPHSWSKKSGTEKAWPTWCTQKIPILKTLNDTQSHHYTPLINFKGVFYYHPRNCRRTHTCFRSSFWAISITVNGRPDHPYFKATTSEHSIDLSNDCLGRFFLGIRVDQGTTSWKGHEREIADRFAAARSSISGVLSRHFL